MRVFKKSVFCKLAVVTLFIITALLTGGGISAMMNIEEAFKLTDRAILQTDAAIELLDEYEVEIRACMARLPNS